MKNKTIVVISWLLVLMTMIVILNFTSETSTESTSTSSGVVVDILDTVMDREDITPPVIKKFQFPIRKCAHFGIYMLLGFCMISAFEKTFKIKMWLNMIFSFIACALFAASDEWMQNYVEGRGPQFTDVLIDSSGALCGILIFIGLYQLYHKVILKKIEEKSRKV